MAREIDFPVDDAQLAFVRSLGLDPNEVARKAFESQVRRLRAGATE